MDMKQLLLSLTSKARTLILLTFLCLSLHPKSEASAATHQVIKKLYILTIDASINPAVYNYLSTSFQRIGKDPEALVIIKMNTPGGLVSTTKQIITLIGESNAPVAIWITPEGASATSAGAIIASSAHFLYMSEGTNIGAATPVQMGKKIEGDMRNKAINDLVALTSSLSEARGRNGKLFGKMISEAASYKSQEAVKNSIVDGIANDIPGLLKLINKKTIKIKGNLKSFSVDPTSETHKLEMDLGQMLLNIFANPMTAYILFIIGAGLLYLEFQAPGGYVAGSIGAISLILAGIGFQVLPIHLGALGLIILAFILFVLEAYITSYGILSIAGIAALFFGSTFLFRSDNGYMEFQSSVVYSTVAAISAFLLVMGFYFAKTRKQKKPKFFSHVKEDGIVMEILEDQVHKQDEYIYQVKVNGIIWKAKSKTKFATGDMITVVEQDSANLQLDIVPQIINNK